jgi:hypothetical protein
MAEVLERSRQTDMGKELQQEPGKGLRSRSGAAVVGIM